MPDLPNSPPNEADAESEDGSLLAQINSAKASILKLQEEKSQSGKERQRAEAEEIISKRLKELGCTRTDPLLAFAWGKGFLLQADDGSVTGQIAGGPCEIIELAPELRSAAPELFDTSTVQTSGETTPLETWLDELGSLR